MSDQDSQESSVSIDHNQLKLTGAAYANDQVRRFIESRPKRKIRVMGCGSYRDLSSRPGKEEWNMSGSFDPRDFREPTPAQHAVITVLVGALVVTIMAWLFL